MSLTVRNAKASRIPIAIVGLGFGRLIVDALQQPPLKNLYRLAALCDLDPKRSVELADKMGVRAATFDEILRDPSIPAVGLFTGPSGRAELVRKAIRAGKHVMTTKPFERDPDVGKDVLEEAVHLGRAVHLNSPSPVLPPDLALIRSWQQKFNLGRPVSAQASVWVRYTELADGSWQDNSILCPAAPIFRIGIYLINDVIEFFGDAEELQIMTSSIFTGRPTPDHAQLSIRFRNGGLVNILASFCVRDGDPYRNTLVLNFENGTVYRNAGAEGKAGAESTLRLVIPGKNDYTDPVLAASEKMNAYSGEYQWANFHRAVTTGALPTPDYPEKVAAGLRIIEAMSKAEQNGGSIKLNS